MRYLGVSFTCKALRKALSQNDTVYVCGCSSVASLSQKADLRRAIRGAFRESVRKKRRENSLQNKQRSVKTIYIFFGEMHNKTDIILQKKSFLMCNLTKTGM